MVANFCGETSPQLIEVLTDNITKIKKPITSSDILSASIVGPTPQKRKDIRQLLENIVSALPQCNGEMIGHLLRLGASMKRVQKAESQYELVWSGPTASTSTLRRTDQVLYELIKDAKKNLLIVTFAAYKVPNAVKALLKAIERGVTVNLILESSEASAGKMKFAALDALPETLISKASIYVWPFEKREKIINGGFGSLHAKVATVDGVKTLISSANLTEHALSLNMEFGILLNNKEITKQIDAHFDSLADAQIIERLK